jgi:hypothetical protein
LGHDGAKNLVVAIAREHGVTVDRIVVGDELDHERRSV